MSLSSNPMGPQKSVRRDAVGILYLGGFTQLVPQLLERPHTNLSHRFRKRTSSSDTQEQKQEYATGKEPDVLFPPALQESGVSYWQNITETSLPTKGSQL